MVAILHTVRTILNQKSVRWLTDSRILKYETILMEKEDLTLITANSLNPSQFLYGKAGVEIPAHDCMGIAEHQTKVREDLQETPLVEGKRIFFDGSSWFINGKCCNGYATVDGEQSSLFEKSQLPNNGQLRHVNYMP